MNVTTLLSILPISLDIRTRLNGIKSFIHAQSFLILFTHANQSVHFHTSLDFD